MDINAIPPSSGRIPGGTPRPRTQAEAARQFEEILVKQLIRTMTDGLFRSPLDQDAPGWIQSNHDAQRDLLTDVLAKHVAESGRLRLSDLLLRQWQDNANEHGTEE
jgi:peptidoglycan hydrolase FlgJ